jgi:hypothetical protein
MLVSLIKVPYNTFVKVVRLCFCCLLFTGFVVLHLLNLIGASVVFSNSVSSKSLKSNTIELSIKSNTDCKPFKIISHRVYVSVKSFQATAISSAFELNPLPI